MHLQDRLNELRQRSESRLPPASKELMHRATAELARSGIMDRVLKVGDPAPEFSLLDAQGNTVSSRELTDRGSLVVSFFRGLW